MSDEQQTSTQHQPVEPEQDPDGLGWVRRQWARARLAHEGVMIARIQRVQRMSETVAKNTMIGDMSDTTGFPNESEGDAMGVDIGDSIVNNYYAASAEPTVAQEGKRPRPSWLLPAALAVGSAFGAAGPLGFLIYQAMKADSETPTPAVETPVDTMQQIVVE